MLRINESLFDGIDENLRQAVEAVFGDARHDARGAEAALEYAALPSINRASWLIPLADKECAAGSAATLPTSSTRRGRLKKYALMATIKMGLGRIFLDRLIVRCSRDTAIAGLVSKMTGEQRPSFALLMGASGANRKVVVQALRPSGEILGYIKIPLTEKAAGRVRAEGEILENLQRFPELRPHIPKTLYAGELGKTPVLFLTPGLGPPAPARWTPMHEDFLRNLAALAPTTRGGRALVAETAKRWHGAADGTPRWVELGRRALDQAERSMRDLAIPCGIVHGDFVFHQMKVQDRRLFVFDWEGARFNAPVWWDYFHFHVGILERPPLRGYPGERACFLLYLLNALADYLEVEPYDSGDDEFLLLQRLLDEELRLSV